MPPKGVKGFFRQAKKKKTPRITKPKISKKSVPSKHVGSLDLKDDRDVDEEKLRQFDMNMAYCPCTGISSRIERWERADKMGMNPPKDVELLLRTRKVRRSLVAWSTLAAADFLMSWCMSN